VTGDLWQTRDLPILSVIADADREGRRVTSAEIAAQLDMKPKDVRLGLRALVDADYLAGQYVSIGPTDLPGFDYAALRLLERGRRATQQWPPEEAQAALLQAIERLLETTADPAERRNLETFRDAGRDLSIGTLSNLLAAWLRDMTTRGGL
jgi:DNA-binding Lrp family transcriptional regulator